MDVVQISKPGRTDLVVVAGEVGDGLLDGAENLQLLLLLIAGQAVAHLLSPRHHHPRVLPAEPKEQEDSLQGLRGCNNQQFSSVFGRNIEP